MGGLVDLGYGKKMKYLPWENRHHPDLQSVGIAGAMIYCEHGEAVIAFSISPEHDAVIAGPKFTVIELDPLSLAQSVAGPCGCQGFIIDGKWVPK